MRVESTLTGAGRRLKIALEIDGLEANLVRVAEDMASEVLSRKAITTKAAEWLANPVAPLPPAHTGAVAQPARSPARLTLPALPHARGMPYGRASHPFRIPPKR